ncbi:transglutaminase [Faecalitalea cylindroides]|uniref:Transglutaminase n=1 Tax=Faecalitalea cylindroides TaxID=39483 RepID=A0A1Y4M1F9_9FIRM|nr:transglutaminase-like domain-containing protein [Faecalitalea cylindroides]OUP62010.1 transglutaminase [Faecalitalea cylindroides]
MMKWKKLLLSLSLCIFVTGCSSSQEYPTEYPESPAQQVSEILWPQSPGVDVLTDSRYAMVDMSNVSQGYVTARLLSSASKIKLQISKDDKKYNYDLTSMEYTAFPLQMGNGIYTIKILSQIEGTKYAVVASTQKEVSIQDEFSVYLYPNQVVNYGPDSIVVNKSFELTKDDKDDLTRIYHLFEYTVDVLDYDYEKADYVSDTYVLPDLTQAIENGSGICFDYASLLAALCRIQGIPARVIVGWTDIEYHAWVEIYLENEGWINPKVYFAKKDWSLVDPTFSDSGNADYTGKYEEVYHY